MRYYIEAAAEAVVFILFCAVVVVTIALVEHSTTRDCSAPYSECGGRNDRQ